jgi:hypothetical protein
MEHFNQQICKNSFLFFKPHEEYDSILSYVKIYEDYSDDLTMNNEYW